MRSRSSRLFVVLLHLVGVSTNLPQHVRHGIVGVHPLSILLEPLELQAAGGLGELLSLLEGAGYDVDKTVLQEPYWLQDDTDGTCLGPSGFSECGDATLWKIRRRRSPRRFQRKKEKSINHDSYLEVHEKVESRGLLGILKSKYLSTVDDSSWEYALELADVNTSFPSSQIGSDATSPFHSEPKECIVSISAFSDSGSESGVLKMGSCESDDAWSWSITEGGVLRWESDHHSTEEMRKKEISYIALGGPVARFVDIISRSPLNYSNVVQSSDIHAQCIWRSGDSAAMTAPCHEPIDTSGSHSLVSFSVIQYQNSAAKSPQLPRFPRIEIPSSGFASNLKEDEDEISHLPHLKRTSHAAGLHLKVDNNQDVGLVTVPQLVNDYQEIKSPLGVGGHFERRIRQTKSAHLDKAVGSSMIYNTTAAKSPRSVKSSPDDPPYKIRKMPINPYIAASKDGMYEDPQTGLKFPTDISGYLGHDRHVTGRHTLTGLGVYTRTMLKIKIYSVAFYVSKMDILEGKAFDDFAFQTADELRSSDEFYHRLMTMGSNSDEGNFDRTLFIKLNMQLATETVRQSLTGEWSLLTDELKALLYASSAKVREADDRMLETIKSKENPSNCSCGQSAPLEYAADPTCCARGTEMVFTWRKNGNMELRINGRVMDVFPQPDIAPGIFYEYLRGDDPISMEARNNFADGFPFLFSPLAQLKGFVSKQDSSVAADQIPKKDIGKKDNHFFTNLFENVQSNAVGAVSWVQMNINGGANNINNVVSSLNVVMQHLGTDWNNFSLIFERKRNEALENLSHIDLMPFKILLSRVPFLKDRLEFDNNKTSLYEDHTEFDIHLNKRNVFQPQIVEMLENSSQQRPISDEIGVIIEPNMSSTHLIFLYSVHLYLVLLLILSVPDSHTARLVVKKSSMFTLDSESDNEERCSQLEASVNDNSFPYDEKDSGWNKVIPRFVVERNGIERNVDALAEDDIENEDDLIDERNSRPIRKALSYFL